MENIELLNTKLEKQFAQTGTYNDFEKYAMSELLSPIEDYFNFVKLVDNNSCIIQGFNLFFIAAYINSVWHIKNQSFLVRLNKEIANLNDYNKSIIYYLNALDIKYSDETDRQKYINFLHKSVECSKNIKFAYNRLELYRVLGTSDIDLFEEAKRNVVEVNTYDSLKEKNTDWWLSSQRYINEFILGTHISDSNYNAFFKR